MLYLEYNLLHMKKALTIFLVFLLVTNANAQLTSSKTEKTEKKILELVLETLKKEHISPKKLDDAFSRDFLNFYVNELDREKIFLFKSDIDEFKKYESQLDNQINKNDLSFFNLTSEKFKRRMIDGKNIYENVLKNKMNFEFGDYNRYTLNKKTNTYDEIKYPKNKEELIKQYNLFFKDMLIKKSIKKLRENKKEVIFFGIYDKYLEEFPAFIETTNYNHEVINKEDIFRIYINSIVKCFDKSSDYWDLKYKNAILKTKTGKFEGTGINLESGNGFVKISKLVTGGPAAKTNKFEIGDVILKVGQENEASINVMGLTHFEAGKLLGGKAGTSVRITTKKTNGSVQEITLKRGIVFFDDSYIKSCLFKKEDRLFGVISIKKFYDDIQEDNSKRKSEVDFALELESLKQENVSGIILDLRENAGESVKSAVNILGNFFINTPITTLKTQNNSEILKTETNTKNWDKPIVVLVNHKTAAAAELIANTFKDYNLAIVIGELTNGKSSIEKFQNLNDLVTNKDEFNDLGVLSFSNQKFYNLNGKSIQRKGIMPDVVFRTDNTLDREANYPQSLLPDEVKPIPFTPINPKGHFASVIKKSQDRLAKSENFKRINAKIAEEINFNNKLSLIKTLNLEKLNTQIEALLASEKVIEELVFDKNRIFSLPSESIKALKKQEYLVSKRNAWLEDMKTDFQIDEGINILEDMLLLKK